MVHFIPDAGIVYVICDSRLEERFDAVEVKLVGADSRDKFEEISAKGVTACLRSQEPNRGEVAEGEKKIEDKILEICTTVRGAQ